MSTEVWWYISGVLFGGGFALTLIGTLLVTVVERSDHDE